MAFLCRSVRCGRQGGARHEQFTLKSLIGCLLIGAGTLVMVL